jgi:GNAT superfamily N-acetyltransferase
MGEAHPPLEIVQVAAADLSPALRRATVDLCSAAYDEDFEPYLALLPDPLHLLGLQGGTLVSHLAWVTRWLQVGSGRPLKTGFIEAVATAPAHQRQGHATRLLATAATRLDDYEIGALSPSEPGFYARLGWELWRGPLATRTDAGLVPTPDEEVMILRLARTPALSLDEPLSVEWRVGEVW